VLLEAIAQMPESGLRESLARLQAAEFLYEARLFPEVEYTFKHALTQEVTYGTILHERRRTLHGRIVEVIERLHPDRLAEYVDRLAHHALRAELWEKTVPYLREAGVKALARSALQEATQCFERALEALEHLPDSRTTRERAIDLRFDLRTALLPQGELARITEHLKTAEALAKAIADRRRLGLIGVYLCAHFWLIADHAESLAAGEQAAACGDFGTETVAQIYLGYTHHSRGEYRRAIELFSAGSAALRAHSIGERFGQFITPSVVAKTFLAHSLVEVGLCDKAIASAKQAVEIAELLDHLPSRMGAYWGLGGAWLGVGRHVDAISELERSVAICRDLGLRGYLHLLGPTLAAAYVAAGRVAEAVALLEEVLNEDATRMMMCYRAPALAVLSEGYLLTGDVERALRAAEHARDLAREKKQRGYEARIAHLFGQIASSAEPLDAEAASGHYHESLSAAADLGMRPLVAHCHLGLGKLYRRTGKRERTHEHLTTATTMYREMDMRFWLEKAEAEMREFA
jgi:tetratricopeptide (TPR) repeat protein